MNLPDTNTLITRLEGGVLWITLNRPDARNAMTPGMLDDIQSVFEAVAGDPAVRAVVMRGAGGHFCAGADLNSMAGDAGKPLATGEPDLVATLNRSFGTMLRKVANAPQVVITVCEGAVQGGGLGLVCVSDIGLTRADARFGLPETTRGLPPAQVAPFVVERVGLTQARRLALTGAPFGGPEALRLGLVHYCCEDGPGLELQLGQVLEAVRNCAPQSNRLTKAILLNVGRLDMDAVLDDAATKFAACVRGSEAPEGIAAFLQKRRPRWADPPC